MPTIFMVALTGAGRPLTIPAHPPVHRAAVPTSARDCGSAREWGDFPAPLAVPLVAATSSAALRAGALAFPPLLFTPGLESGASSNAGIGEKDGGDQDRR